MVFRDKAKDGTTRLTGGVPDYVPEATVNGVAYMGSGAIATTNTTYVTLVTVPIPSAGTWVINFNARLSAPASAHGVVALFNGAGAVVANSETFGVGTNTTSLQASLSRSITVTTTGAETFTVRARSGGVYNVSWFHDANGYTAATWFELLGSSGPQGTRWGNINTFIFGTASNVPVTFPDGLPPRVGDWVVSSNGLSPGQVAYVTAVIDATHADFTSSPPLSLRGADGPAGTPGIVSLLDVYPVGAIYMSTVNTNPGTLFGGTWAVWGSGRVAVGVDPAQTEFDTVEETGGAKSHTISAANLPPHAHTGPAHTHNIGFQADGDAGTGASWRVKDIDGQTPGAGTSYVATTGGATAGNTGNGPGTSTAFDLLQPYITCYMWKRTA